MLGLNVIDPVTARYVNEYAERRHRKHGEKHEKKGHHENHDKKGHGEEHSKQTKKDDDGQNQGPEPEGQPRKDDQVENDQFYDIDEDKETMQDLLRQSYSFLDDALRSLKVVKAKYNPDDEDSRFIEVNINSLNAHLHEIKKFFETRDWILPKSRADNVITVTQVKSKVSKPFQAEREQDLKRDPVLYKAWRKATHHEE